MAKGGDRAWAEDLMRPKTMTSFCGVLGRNLVASIALALCGLGWAADMSTSSFHLAGMQNRVEAALSRADTDGSGGHSALAIIDGELAALQRVDRDDYYANYWKSYLLYRKALRLMSSPEFKKGEAPLAEAIDLLKGTAPRDVEVVALLGLIANMHLAYVPRHRIILASNQARDYLDEALKLDGENARALYANAVTDYFTPEEYGGKKNTERLLKKALEKMPHDAAGLAPRWGRRDAATLLVFHYMDEGRLDDARSVLGEARLRWPNDPSLLQLKSKLDPVEARTKEPDSLPSP